MGWSFWLDSVHSKLTFLGARIGIFKGMRGGAFRIDELSLKDKQTTLWFGCALVLQRGGLSFCDGLQH